MNGLVKRVLLDHFPTMTNDQLDRMQYDNSGCYHDAFGDEKVWVSPQLIYRLLQDLSDEYEYELRSAAEEVEWLNSRIGHAWDPSSMTDEEDVR